MRKQLALALIVLISAAAGFSEERNLQTIHYVGDSDVKTTEELKQALITSAKKNTIVKTALDRIKSYADSAVLYANDPDFQEHSEDRISRQVFDLAICYTVSSENKYFDSAAILFERLIKKVSFAVFLTGGSKPDAIENRNWLLYLAKSYDILYNDLMPAERLRFGKWLKAMAAVVLKQWKWEDSKNTSIGSWQSATIGIIGCALDDDKVKETAKNMVQYQFRKMIGPEGIWREGSLELHFEAAKAFYAYAQADNSLFSMSDVGNNIYLKQMVEAPLMFLDPFGKIPGNNSTRTEYPPADIYLSAFREFREPEFGYIVEKQLGSLSDEIVLLNYFNQILPGPVRANPPFSVFNSTIGWGILRTGVTSPRKDLYARLDYGPHGGAGGHADKLSLYFCGFGRRVTTDENTDDLILDFEWAKQTLAHNTVVLNYRSQSGAKTIDDSEGLPGNLLLFDRRPGISVIEADAQNAYLDTPVKNYRRCVALTDNYFIDIFTIQSDESVAADWVFHGLGKQFAFRNAAAGEKSLNNDLIRESLLGSSSDGYQWIERVESYTANDQWSIVWSSGLRTIFLGWPGTRILIGKSGGNVEMVGDIVTKRTHTERTLIVRRINIEKTRFVAVHEILSSNIPEVKSFTKLETGTDALVLEIEGDDFKDIFLLQPKHVEKKIMIDDRNLMVTKPQRYAYVRIDKKTNKVIKNANARLERVE